MLLDYKENVMILTMLIKRIELRIGENRYVLRKIDNMIKQIYFKNKLYMYFIYTFFFSNSYLFGAKLILFSENLVWQHRTGIPEIGLIYHAYSE